MKLRYIKIFTFSKTLNHWFRRKLDSTSLSLGNVCKQEQIVSFSSSLEKH